MDIAVASGKGGTGKTTVAVNLALSLKRKVNLLDCDVEEPNSNIFLDIEFDNSEDVFLKVPKVDEEKCTNCGKCAELCEFNALAVLKDKVLLFEELCHACGLCSLACPENAIQERERKIGTISFGRDKNINFYQGELNVGEAMSSPIIRELKRKRTEGLNILDVPPGTGCPVIESLQDVDYAILVTEPTPFGMHDLKLSVGVVRKMGIHFGVIINMYHSKYQSVENYCKEEDIPILMKIPLSVEIAKLYSKGIPFIKEMPEWREEFRSLIQQIEVSI